jgi:membrane-associated phospholipid phosphatase
MQMTDPDTNEARRGARFGVRAVLVAVALGLVAVPFSLLLLSVEAQWTPLLLADQAARDDLHAFALTHAGFVTVMDALSTIGRWWAYLIGFAMVLGWLLWRRLVRLALFVVVTVGGSGLLNETVKAAVHRARPVLTDPVAHESGTSFPSGHAQGAMVGYAVLLLVFLPVLRGVARPIAIAAAALMVLAIGFSRVALGVHYVSDVLAGYLLGAAWVAAMIGLFNIWRRERGPSRPADGLEPHPSA